MSAVSRGLRDLPVELARRVFLEVDEPLHFSQTCKLFYFISKDIINVCKWFEFRYYPSEIIWHMLKRHRMVSTTLLMVRAASVYIKTKLIYHKAAVRQGAHVSRLLVSNLQYSPGYPRICLKGYDTASGNLTSIPLREDHVELLVELCPYFQQSGGHQFFNPVEASTGDLRLLINFIQTVTPRSARSLGPAHFDRTSAEFFLWW